MAASIALIFLAGLGLTWACLPTSPPTTSGTLVLTSMLNILNSDSGRLVH